jgi:hypothetical protein
MNDAKNGLHSRPFGCIGTSLKVKIRCFYVDIDVLYTLIFRKKQNRLTNLQFFFQVIVAIGTLQHPSQSSYNTLNLEKENVTIDFSSQDNYCPDSATQKVDSVKTCNLKLTTLNTRNLIRT